MSFEGPLQSKLFSDSYTELWVKTSTGAQWAWEGLRALTEMGRADSQG